VATHLTSPSTQTAALPAVQQILPAPTLSIAEITPPVVATQANTIAALITDAPDNDSLAQLEAFLIPNAGAANNRTSGTDEASAMPVDDKTLSSLRSYKSALDKRASELDQRVKSLQQAEEKLQQRITELEQLEASIQQRLQDEAGIKTKKIKRLTSVYEGMKPEKAAPVIAQMELATVVKIFSLMDEKKVGKILSFLPADKAVLISQALTRQISTVK